MTTVPNTAKTTLTRLAERTPSIVFEKKFADGKTLHCSVSTLANHRPPTACLAFSVQNDRGEIIHSDHALNPEIIELHDLMMRELADRHKLTITTEPADASLHDTLAQSFPHAKVTFIHPPADAKMGKRALIAATETFFKRLGVELHGASTIEEATKVLDTRLGWSMAYHKPRAQAKPKMQTAKDAGTRGCLTL